MYEDSKREVNSIEDMTQPNIILHYGDDSTQDSNEEETCNMYIQSHASNISCSVCGKSCKSDVDLLEHLKSHTFRCSSKAPPINHVCDFCGETFVFQQSIDSHKKVCYKKPCRLPETCLLTSSLTLTSNKKPPNRIISDEGMRLYKCIICGKGFALQQSKDLHEKVCNKKPPLFTSSFTFASKKKPPNRMISGGDMRPYKCVTCGEAFMYEEVYNLHIQWHNRLIDPPPSHPCISCSICGKTFQNNDDLVVHVKTHSLVNSLQAPLKPHKCLHCSETFIFKQSLESHMKCHEKANLYYCSLCGKGIETKEYAKACLIRKHSTNKVLKSILVCNKCRKVYKNECSFNFHVSLHKVNGESPLSLSDKIMSADRTTSSESQKRHQNLHTSDNPYVVHIKVEEDIDT